VSVKTKLGVSSHKEVKLSRKCNCIVDNYGNKTEWSSVFNEIINDKIGWTPSRGPLLSITSLITNRNGTYEGRGGGMGGYFLGVEESMGIPPNCCILRI